MFIQKKQKFAWLELVQYSDAKCKLVPIFVLCFYLYYIYHPNNSRVVIILIFHLRHAEYALHLHICGTRYIKFVRTSATLRRA